MRPPNDFAPAMMRGVVHPYDGPEKDETSVSIEHVLRATALDVRQSEKVGDYFAYMEDPDLYEQYLANQRKYYDFSLILPLVLLLYIAVITRSNMANFGSDGPWFTTAMCIACVASIFFLPYLAARMVVHYTPCQKRLGLTYRTCKRCLCIFYRVRVEDIVGILAVLAAGFCLLGRVYAGQCDYSINAWNTQTCNPFADIGYIPSDQVIVMYLLPLMSQCIVRGITIYALVSCCVISFAFIVTATAHVGGFNETWTILYSFIFLIIMIMIERSMRTTFIQGLAMIAASELGSKHELELLELSSGNERNLKEKEMFQLRSLMGNVAHDLKTPLHSIEGDVEILRLFISKIPGAALETAMAEFRVIGSGESFDPRTICDSLTASCKFMAMAINRGQDFMKASNNIALVPAMENFEIASALSTSVTCMNHLQLDRTITVHPIEDSVSSYIVSDKLWLSENMLCLLSNAMKFSDNGTVDVRVKLIDVPIQTENDVTLGSSASRHPPSQRNFCTSIAPLTDECSVDHRNYSAHLRDRRFLAGAGAQHETARSRSSKNCRSSVFPSDKSVAGSDLTKCGSGKQRMILITVEDFGIGVAFEARKNIFEPLIERTTGGTGIGLYSLSKRVEALGGKAGVADRSDGKQGSMFWFTFPYRPGVVSRATTLLDAIESPYNNPLMSSDSAKPSTILVVDDSLAVLKVTSRLLKMNGHSVETAQNGSVALKLLKEAFESQEYDMLLTDLQMPVMDGIESTRLFREFEEEVLMREIMTNKAVKSKKLVIVGMSANSDNESKQEALDSGMNYFVPKPFSYNDLQLVFRDNQV